MVENAYAAVQADRQALRRERVGGHTPQIMVYPRINYFEKRAMLAVKP